MANMQGSDFTLAHLKIFSCNILHFHKTSAKEGHISSRWFEA
jgi:hypothetical protein